MAPTSTHNIRVPVPFSGQTLISAVTVSLAGPEQRGPALSLLLDRAPADDLEAAESLKAGLGGDVPLDGLLTAAYQGVLVGALLYVRQSADTALVWPPGIRPLPSLEADRIADALLQETASRLADAEVVVAQCLLERDDFAGRRAMERNGFVHLADLTFLERAVREPLTPRSPAPLVPVPFDARRNGERFARIVEQTYQGTLDCPGLNGVRTASEALRSHQHAADFDPRLWNVYRADEVDVGVMLLGEHADQDAWEILYVGVVPEARGRGYGRAMVLEGLHASREAGRAAVVLAVDDRNHYAKAIYHRLGFAELARRSAHVWLRPAPPVSNPHVVHTP